MDNRFTSRDLSYIALGAVFITLCSWISVPTTIPFTMQTFAVFLILLLLGGRNGTVSIAVYILIGCVGMPVFAGFTGGIGILLGTTGGYFLGFLLTGLVYWLSERLFGGAGLTRALSLLLGLLFCYAFGTAWFMLVYAKQAGAVSLMTALTWCVFPFILPDLAKMALALAVSSRLGGRFRTR